MVQDAKMVALLTENKSILSKSNEETVYFTVNTSSATQFSSPNYEVYVFRAGRDTMSFSNYIIVKDKEDNIIEDYYLRYYPSTAWAAHHTQDDPFEGEVSRYDHDGNFVFSTNKGLQNKLSAKSSNIQQQSKAEACDYEIYEYSVQYPCGEGEVPDSGYDIPETNVCATTVYVIVEHCNGGGGGDTTPTIPDYGGTPPPTTGGGAGSTGSGSGGSARLMINL
ncbi:hypothetical protein ACG2LH_04440 [Zhouia sp. PK063]|uniref:hypothetical protein n=1 Tax=Zhouia sp. PK063 TaxID=3373602 RepID=UPI00378EF98B